MSYLNQGLILASQMLSFEATLGSSNATGAWKRPEHEDDEPIPPVSPYPSLSDAPAASMLRPLRCSNRFHALASQML
jgi:hypothetical protein